MSKNKNKKVDKWEGTLDRRDEFIGLVNTICPNVVSQEMIDWLVTNKFFDAPASRKYHGAHKGGLYDHSKTVASRLMELTTLNNLCWIRPESPFIVGMFHDLCKIDQYLAKWDTSVEVSDNGDITLVDYNWNNNQLLKGHGDKSIMLLSQFMTLTEEEVLCIRYHMGAFVEKEEWNDYTRAARKYETVLWTHHADMLASHVNLI